MKSLWNGLIWSLFSINTWGLERSSHLFKMIIDTWHLKADLLHNKAPLSITPLCCLYVIRIISVITETVTTPMVHCCDANLVCISFWKLCFREIGLMRGWSYGSYLLVKDVTNKRSFKTWFKLWLMCSIEGWDCEVTSFQVCGGQGLLSLKNLDPPTKKKGKKPSQDTHVTVLW